MTYQPPHPPPSGPAVDDSTMPTRTPDTQIHPHGSAPGANAIYHPSPYTTHPLAPSHPQHHHTTVHAQLPITALSTHPPPAPNHPSYRSNGNSKNVHLRGASYSSVSSSGTNAHPSSHSRRPSQANNWTPSLQAIQAGTPHSHSHIDSSPLASMGGMGGMGGQGYQYSPTMHHQHAHGQLHPYPQPPPHLSQHQNAQGPIGRSFHPNVPSAPTPLKRSVSSSFAISHGHAQPGLYQYASPHSQPQTSAQVNGSPMMQTQQGQHTTGNVFGYNLTVIPPSNGNSTAASPIMQHAQVDMSGSQQGQMSTPQYVQMYTSPSHAMPHLESYPTYPHATYQLPNGTINAPAFAPSQPTTAPPIQFGQQPQAHIVEMDDESAEIEPEVEADADGGYEYEANVSRLQSHGGGTMVHPSRSRASSISDSSDSGGSSFSLEQSSRGARGGRGRGGARGGARGRGTKRKAKGSGWTKRKPARESAQNKGFKLGRPAGGRSGTATATTIAHSAEPGPSVQAFAQIPVYPTAPAPAPIPTYQAQYHTHSGLAETYDPTAFPEDGTAPPPEIAILLKNLQPGPLILPPPGCGLQIANLLIHVPAELSESKEIQLASKRWAHVIDASGAPMMLDPIRPHVHEQYTCRCCRKTYTGKNARSVARRHLQDKHGVPLVLQERRSRWDRSIRAKDTAEAHEREKKSKRESAKRARENQRLARAKVAAFAAGDTTVYTPGSSSAPSAFTRAPISDPRPSLRSAPTGTNTAITATEGTPLVPVSPDYSLNSDGSPVLAGTASGRHNTPIEMVASIDSSSAQPMQNGVNGVGAHRQSEFDQRFEQTRSHLQKQGWSEQDIGAYYQQLAGGWIGLPPATAEAPLQGTVTGVGSVEMSRTGYGYPHGAVQPMPPSQAHGNVKPGPKSSRRKSHKRAASVSSSTSSWVHVENETPDYAQLKGQQTWVVPPPSVSADTPFTRAPLQSMQQNMSIGHGHLMGPAYTLTGGMGMGMGPSTVAASQDDAEVAAAGLVDLSSPIKGQPVKKKARPMPMRRANTVAVPSGDLMTGPAFGWSGQQLAPHDVGQVSQPLTIDTHAASGTAIDQAPLSAPASGSNPTFFPSTYAGNGPNIMLDHSANNHHSAESPLAYLSQSGQAGTAANGAGPSRIPRQPFARGRAQLARSISFSLPSTNSPIRLDDLDVFSQSMSRTNSLAGTEGPDDVQEGRENKRAKRSSAHGRTKASELLQPISERIQPLSEEESSGSTRAGDVKATGMGGVTATATGSPVTRGRKARAGTSGLVLGKKAGVRLALGSVSVDLGKAGQENSLPGPTMGLVQSPMKGGLLALAQSAPEQTYSLGSTTKLGSATASANGSPMFKLAANAFKTPLKQRDLNSKGNGTANLAPTLSDLNTPARLELEYTTPAPFSRLQSGNKAKNTSMHSHTRSLGFEPYSTGNSSSTRPGGSSMLTSLAPTPQPLGMLITPRRPGTSAGASAGGGTSTKYPQSVTRNWAGLSSPAHAGLAHQLGLTIGDGAADWQTPRVLRELNGQITRVGPLETPGMVDADADWDDEVL